ncbi:MAG: amino acid ABC transporter ATP-binding protein [Lachnospiraceae bacterium]|nr:amino acid ABC transporter ATP-binding protein [Lachnospiraceae bacterium]
MALLEVKRLVKSFDRGTVLKGIDFTVDKGDVVAVLGPSGSGKTTMLRCLNYLETADSGSMVFDGVSYDMSLISKKEIADLRKHTGFVFQGYNLFSNKTVLENVTLGLTSGRRMDKKEAGDIALKELDRVGMSDYADRYPAQLSGGQQQRVAIARALAPDPKIIYFDEPTSALDPELTMEVLDVMKKLAESGITMVVVTHEMSFAKDVSSKAVFMDDGSVVETGDSRSFFADPKEERTREFINNTTSH